MLVILVLGAISLIGCGIGVGIRVPVGQEHSERTEEREPDWIRSDAPEHGVFPQDEQECTSEGDMSLGRQEAINAAKEQIIRATCGDNVEGAEVKEYSVEAYTEYCAESGRKLHVLLRGGRIYCP